MLMEVNYHLCNFIFLSDFEKGSKSKMLPLKLFWFSLVCKCAFADLGIDIDLQSFGCQDVVGKDRDCRRPELRTWIKVNGRDTIRRGRGWNIVAVNHMTGEIEGSASFDTYFSRLANTHLETFIKRIKPKRIVLGVVHDDGGYKLDGRGIRILNSVAGYGFYRGVHHAMAFVGYKDHLPPPKNFVERVFKKLAKGPAQIRVTIGKIKYGDELQFALQSTGYLDRRGLAPSEMRSYIKYGDEQVHIHYGLSLMIVEHTTGHVHDKKVFDTHHSGLDTLRLFDYIKALPRNLIVLGVAHSDWTRHTGSEIAGLLHGITFSRIPNTYDGSWAFVGYTGGKSSLPAFDFPLSRMTTKTTPHNSYRHWVKMNYFTNRLDDDECTNGKAKCGENMACRNTIGSYECVCKEGFEKKGRSCVDINECHIGSDICGLRAKCKNTPGSYTCQCEETAEMKKIGIHCREITIAISGPDCLHKSEGKPAVCKKLPLKIEVNEENLVKIPRPGFRLVVLNSHTGRVEKNMAFDTRMNVAEGAWLGRVLFALEKYKIVIGTVLNDEKNEVSKNSWALIKKYTGINPPTKFLGAFGFIGFTGPGVADWTTAQTTKLYGGPSITKSRFWLLPKPPFMTMSMTSVGYTKGAGPVADIQFEGKHLGKYLKPGFNIAVFNAWTGTLEIVRNFQTHSQRSADVEHMTNFLNSLPVDRIVAGVVKGEAFQGIQYNYRIQQALARLVAAPIRLQSIGASYAFIGASYTGITRKPAYIKQVSVEAGKGPAKLSSVVGFGYKAKEIEVSLVSTGCDDPGPHRTSGVKCHLAACSIKVNGQELALNGRGINLVVISQVSGHVLNRKRFDTGRSHSEAVKMAEFIDSIPNLAIVLGVVKDDARRYFRIKKLTKAMQKVICQPEEFVVRGAYAFIGKKGNGKEIWVTQKHTAHGKGGIHLTAEIPLRPELRIELESVACGDKGAKTCDLCKGVIRINGQDFSKNRRGLNLAVVNLANGEVERTGAFDTWEHKEDSRKLEIFIASLPKQRVVLGVVKNEGFNKLSPTAQNSIASLIHKSKIAFRGRWESYVFVGFTSNEHYLWIQDLRSPRHKGPTQLSVGIPLTQRGCVFPAAPSNGQVRRFEYDVTQEAEYKCANGLGLKGRPQTCTSAGIWKGGLPSCEKLSSSSGSSGSEDRSSGSEDSREFSGSSSSSPSSSSPSSSSCLPSSQSASLVFAFILMMSLLMVARD